MCVIIFQIKKKNRVWCFINLVQLFSFRIQTYVLIYYFNSSDVKAEQKDYWYEINSRWEFNMEFIKLKYYS